MRQDHLTRTTDPTTTDHSIRATASALVHSHDLDDFKFSKGETDPRGWDVMTVQGAKVGKVADLLVDTRAGRVRYVEVAVDRDVAKRAKRDYVLVPVGTARLDEERDDVIVDLSATELAEIPIYDRKLVSRDYEQSLRSYLHGRSAGADTGGGTESTDQDFYADAYYDDRSFFGARRRRGRESGPADRSV